MDTKSGSEMTDGRLIRLKDFVYGHGLLIGNERDYEQLLIGRDVIKALIARMEAAERVCTLVQSKAWVRIDDELESWLNAAGK